MFHQWQETTRSQSPIFNLKCFQNFLKTILLDHALLMCNSSTTKSTTSSTTTSPSTPPTSTSPPINVLDLCGGKGGDLTKYMHYSQIKQVVLVDISENSLRAAHTKYKNLCLFSKFNFQTHWIDAWSPHPFFQHEQFDLIICHFAFHYAAKNLTSFHQGWNNMSQCLKKGGHLILTCPNPDRVKLFRNNNICTIQFLDQVKGEQDADGGKPYNFTLIDSVKECTEYLMPSNIQMIEYGLQHHFQVIKYGKLMDLGVETSLKNTKLAKKMHVCNQALSQEEQAVADLYDYFIWEKI